MNANTVRMMELGALFVLTLLSGVWLSNSGKPLNSWIFAVHKMIAVGMIIFLGVTVRTLYRTMDPQVFAALAVILVTGLVFLAVVVSGSLLSFNKPMPGIVLALHKVTPFLAGMSTAATIYLLLGGRS